MVGRVCACVRVCGVDTKSPESLLCAGILLALQNYLARWYN